MGDEKDQVVDGFAGAIVAFGDGGGRAGMARFLDHPAAPPELQALLLRCSAVLEDREAAERLTGWAQNRRFEALVDAQETLPVDQKLALLRQCEPDLAGCCDTAIIAAVAAASLRWPESAARFEEAFPRMMTLPRRDAVIATVVTRLHPGPLFSVRPADAHEAAWQALSPRSHRPP